MPHEKIDEHSPLGLLSNRELLRRADELLLEIEHRLVNYARVGPGLAEMADEGLLLASRVDARLQQTARRAVRARVALQVVGVGDWEPQGLGRSVDERLADADELRLNLEEEEVDDL